MKTIALDLGSKSCGVAISDVSNTFARPLDNIRFDVFDASELIVRIKAILNAEPITTIVLGLPKNMDGSLGSQAEHSLQFKQDLEAALDLPVVLVDERMTSKMAHATNRQLGKKKKQRQAPVDAYAASIILQDYLDAQKQKEVH